MTTAAEVLSMARNQLGTTEIPVGSNNVIYNSWYYGRPVQGGAYPWCAVFVSWVAQAAAATSVIPKHAYTPAGAAWFASRGQFSRTPKVGDVVYYHFAGMGRISHCGIVESVNSDGSWIAIEGNTDGAGSRTGGKVMRQKRTSVGSLGGFGHPAYTAAPSVAPAQAQAQVQAQVAMPVLRRGSSDSAAVRQLQTLLIQKGYLTQAQVDTGPGVFGPATDAAVRKYQSQHGLESDGAVGKLTWGSLRS